MPTTSSGETVYAEPEATEAYVQQQANQFSLADSFGDPTEWREFLEARQVEAKARIDEYTGRDFENHTGETITLDGGATSSRFLELPTPVQSLTEIRVDGEALTSEQYALRDQGQLVRVANDHQDDEYWPAGYGNIEIDLDWGYQTPPADIAEAEKKLVNNTLSGLAQMREGMIVQQDDVDVTVNLPSAMTAELRGMLRTHRNHGRSAGVI